jgi:hypothetical protein
MNVLGYNIDPFGDNVDFAFYVSYCNVVQIVDLIPELRKCASSFLKLNPLTVSSGSRGLFANDNCISAALFLL